MSKEEVWNSFLQIFTKTLLPALVGISISLATKMKKSKISKTSALTSIIIGLGLAFVLSDPIHIYLGKSWAGATLGAIGIFGEKFTHWAVFDFEFKIIGDTIANRIKKVIDGK